ncbi:MAG: DUF5985 family protein [Longimicrobiales bacterium]
MVDFLAGALAMGYFVAALFFLRFWRDTHERLFAYFSSSFLLLAIQRLALVLLADNPAFPLDLLYVIRLFAFSLILVGIIAKNRAAQRGV